MDKKRLKNLLEKEAWVYEFLAKEYQADKELACVAVNNGDVFAFVPKKLQQDKEVILAAIEWDGLPYEAGEEWYEDMDILRALVAVEPWNYEEFPEEVQNNREIALECVKVRGDVYESLPEEWKEDEEIAEEAIRHGQSLKEFRNYLDNPASKTAEKLLSRADLVHTAIEKNDGNQMIYADEKLWGNKKLAEFALAKGFCHIRHLSDKQKAEKETVKRVIRNIPENNSSDEWFQLIYMAEQLRSDKEFLLELISIHEMVFHTIVQSQKDPRIEELFTRFPVLDADFCKKAYAANKKCIKYMNKKMKAAVKQ